MAKTLKPKRNRAPKSVLKLPDLEQSKSAVLNSLTSPSSLRSYDHAIREFIDWYCSTPSGVQQDRCDQVPNLFGRAGLRRRAIGRFQVRSGRPYPKSLRTDYGQTLFVFPKQNLIVVFTGWDLQNESDMNVIMPRLIPAIKEAACPGTN